MTDRQLFRKLLPHGAIGAAPGAVFAGIFLLTNVRQSLDLIQNSVAPKTTTIILIVGCCAYFAFGAAITGFHFILMEIDPDGRPRSSRP